MIKAWFKKLTAWWKEVSKPYEDPFKPGMLIAEHALKEMEDHPYLSYGAGYIKAVLIHIRTQESTIQELQDRNKELLKDNTRFKHWLDGEDIDATVAQIEEDNEKLRDTNYRYKDTLETISVQVYDSKSMEELKIVADACVARATEALKEKADKHTCRDCKLLMNDCGVRFCKRNAREDKEPTDLACDNYDPK